jgi:MoaA/NifB/PqqE/SkfB family radical SAM enzyme
LPKAKIIFSSNGFATELILKRVEEILLIDKNIGVAISLDGMADTHNQVRGIGGGFDKAIKTIEGLKKLGVKHIKIAFTLGDYNIQEFRKVYALSRDLGLEFTLAVVHSAENYFGKENKIDKKEAIIKELDWLVKQEIKSFKPKRWLRAYFAYGMIEFLKTDKRVLKDYSGVLSAFVDPSGKIFASDVSENVIGNLDADGFELKPVQAEDVKESWMICTARQAIKENKLKVILWILRKKIYEHIVN